MTASWRAVGAVAHDQHHAPATSSDVTQNLCEDRDCRADAHAAITLAVLMLGRKRGFAAAAAALQRSERWVHGFHYHDEGAAPPNAHAALMTLRRQRAAQIRDELATMETDDIAIDMVARARASSGVCG